MPKARHICDITSDVTLNDFANTKLQKGCSRLKKKSVLNISSEVKVMNNNEDGRGWEEKLNDWLPIIDVEAPVEKLGRKSSRKKARSQLEVNDSGIDYPIDVWYLISKYISPEDVGTFACICQTSNEVVKSANFWLSMYHRYYRESDSTPEHFQPARITRRYKLRMHVVQFLYFVYPLFTSRTKQRVYEDPHSLIGRQCVTSWVTMVEGKANEWVYNFKLKEYTAMRGRTKAKSKPDLLTLLDDIHANADEDCKLLQVRSNAYCPIPMVTNQRLAKCSMAIEMTYHYRRLVMHFCTSQSGYEPSTVSIHRVIGTRVLNWWDIDYVPCASLTGREFAPLMSHHEFIDEE